LPDAYRVLQVDPSAEPEVIEAAYRRLARKYHPDVSDDPDAAARMRELSAAYDAVRDPERRAEYDRRRGHWWSPQRLWRTWRPSPPVPAQKVHGEGPAQWSERPACWQHTSVPAVDTCSVCGATLCRWCASPFQPAGCALCVMQRARRIQRRAVLGGGIFGTAFLTVLMTVAPFGGWLWNGVVIAYLAAATALGIAVVAGGMWRSGWEDEPGEGGSLGVAFLVWMGLLVGWLGAPLLLGKLAWDFRRGRQLMVSAQAALQAP
jgi:DnaJ domain